MPRCRPGAAVAQAKIDAEAAAAKREFDLKKELQDREAELAHAKALDEFNLKKFVAEKEIELAEMKASHERDIKNRQMQAAEQDKIEAKNAAVDAEMLPVVVQQLEQTFTALAQFMQRSLEFQQQMIQEVKKGDTISDIKIQKDSNGAIIGARVKKIAAGSGTVQ